MEDALPVAGHPPDARPAARWLACYLDEREPDTLEEVAFVLGCLAALAGDERELALASLRAVSKGRRRNGRF